MKCCLSISPFLILLVLQLLYFWRIRSMLHSFCDQAISNHAIAWVLWTAHCLLWRLFSTAGVVSAMLNDRKCQYLHCYTERCSLQRATGCYVIAINGSTTARLISHPLIILGRTYICVLALYSYIRKPRIYQTFYSDSKVGPLSSIWI